MELEINCAWYESTIAYFMDKSRSCMENGDYFYNAVKKILLKHNVSFKTIKAYEDFIHDLARLFEV